MAVTVLFFGVTADITNKRRIGMALAAGVSAGSIIEKIVDRYPGLASHRLLYAINREYATRDDRIRDGDEIAIFTAVSGG